MKRILVLNYEFPPLGGGGGVAAYKLAKGFIELGYQVDYITTWFKGLKKFEIVDGVNVYRVKVLGRKELSTATMLSMYTCLLTGFIKGVQLCKKNKYEFINTHFVVPTGPLGYLLSKIFRIKNILSLIGGDIYDPSKKTSPHKHALLRFFVSFLINKADKVTAISNNTKENAIKYYGIKRDIEVIGIPYEYVEFESINRKDLGLSEDIKYIVGVGRLVKRKGFDFFIKTIAKLPNNVKGIIIGDGPEEQYLKNLASELNIADRVIFTGFVDQNKKFQYLQNGDIFFLSSIHEGFGIVLQEAMQVGLPIVATNNGGQVDLVKDGENGFLIECDNLVQSVEKIKSILDSNLFSRQELILNKNLFNLDEIAQKYISYE